MGVFIIFFLVHAGWAFQRFKDRDILPLLSGSVTRDEFLSYHLKEYEVMRQTNRILNPQKDKILFVFLGHRGYYSNIPYTYDFHDPGLSWRRWLDKAQTVEDLRAQIRQEGISHLMFPWYFLNRSIDEGMAIVEPEKKALLKQFFHKNQETLIERNNVRLTRIK